MATIISHGIGNCQSRLVSQAKKTQTATNQTLMRVPRSGSVRRHQRMTKNRVAKETRHVRKIAVGSANPNRPPRRCGPGESISSGKATPNEVIAKKATAPTPMPMTMRMKRRRMASPSRPSQNLEGMSTAHAPARLTRSIQAACSGPKRGSGPWKPMTTAASTLITITTRALPNSDPTRSVICSWVDLSTSASTAASRRRCNVR